MPGPGVTANPERRSLHAVSHGAVAVVVQLPPVLRQAVGGLRAVEGEGCTVSDVVASVVRNYPALGLHLYNDRGELRRNVLFVHRGEAIRPNEAHARMLDAGDEIAITNALAGG